MAIYSAGGFTAESALSYLSSNGSNDPIFLECDPPVTQEAIKKIWEEAIKNPERSAETSAANWQITEEYRILDDLYRLCIQILFCDGRRINKKPLKNKTLSNRSRDELAEIKRFTFESTVCLADVNDRCNKQITLLIQIFSIYRLTIPKFQELKLDCDQLFGKFWEFFNLQRFSILSYSTCFIVDEKTMINSETISRIFTKKLPQISSSLTEELEKEEYDYSWLGKGEIMCRFTDPCSVNFHLIEMYSLLLDGLAKNKYVLDDPYLLELLETKAEKLLRGLENSPVNLELIKSTFKKTLANLGVVLWQETSWTFRQRTFYLIRAYMWLIRKCSCIPHEQKKIFELINGVNSLIQYFNDIDSHTYPDNLTINHDEYIKKNTDMIGETFYAAWYRFLRGEELPQFFLLSVVNTNEKLKDAAFMGNQMVKLLQERIDHLLKHKPSELELKESLTSMSNEIDSIIPLLDYQPPQEISESIRREEWYQEKWGPWLIPEQGGWQLSGRFFKNFCSTMERLANTSPQTDDVLRKKAEELVQRIIEVLSEKRKQQKELSKDSAQWKEHEESIKILHQAFDGRIRTLSKMTTEGKGQTLSDQIKNFTFNTLSGGLLGKNHLSIEILQRKFHYANVGYSMVDELQKLMSESNFNIKEEISNFFEWAKKHPKASQEMMGDIFQTLNTLFSEANFMEQVSDRMTTQFYVYTLLDALGANHETGPLELEKELRYRAIADLWRCVPLFARMTKETIKVFHKSQSLHHLIRELAINLPKTYIEGKVIQTVANTINMDYMPLIGPLVDCVSGKPFGKVLQTHQELVMLRQLSKLSRSLLNPEEIAKRLDLEWKVWKKTLLQSQGRERVWRVLTNVGIPLVFVSLSRLALQASLLMAICPQIPAFAFLAATSYYLISRWLDYFYTNWHLEVAKEEDKSIENANINGYIENYQQLHLLPKDLPVSISEKFRTEIKDLREKLIEDFIKELKGAFQEVDQLPFELVATYDRILNSTTLKEKIAKQLEVFVADYVEKNRVKDYLVHEIRLHCLNELLQPALVQSFNRLRDQIREEKLEKDWGWNKDQKNQPIAIPESTLRHLEGCGETLKKDDLINLIKNQAAYDPQLRGHNKATGELIKIFVEGA